MSEGKIVFYDSHKELYHLTKRQLVKELEKLCMDGSVESSVTGLRSC